MIFKIIMFLSLWWIIPLMYWVMKKEIRSGNHNIIFGVTIPKEYTKEPEIEAIQKRCEKQMKWIVIVSGVLGLLILFVPWISVMLTLYMIWLWAGLAVLICPFGLGFQKLKNLKKERGWYRLQQSLNLVDMGLAENKIKVRFLPYLPPIIISFLPILYECIFAWEKDWFAFLLIVLILVGSCTVIMWLCAWWISRMKSEIISTDSSVNSNFNRIRVHNWNRCFLWAAWMNTVYTLGIWIYLEADIRHAAGRGGLFGFIIGSVLYGCLLCAAFFRYYTLIRKNQKKLLEQAEAPLVDDDENWIWGMFYYNPNDRHFMVNKRVGVGTTCNMATTGGKVFTGIGLMAMLLSVVLCAALIGDEFTPVDLQIHEKQLEAIHRKIEYTVDIEKIETLELLTEGLPEASKMYGTGMDNVYKGVFSIKGYKDCKVCLAPQNQVFILMILEDGTRYLVSDKTDEETRAVYEQLCQFP